MIVAPALVKYEIHWVTTPEEASALRDSLCDSLRDSLCDSLWSSGWVAFYLAPVRAGILALDPDKFSRLEAFANFGESAFALWVLPGHVIVLEKPKYVSVIDGRLVDISW